MLCEGIDKTLSGINSTKDVGKNKGLGAKEILLRAALVDEPPQQLQSRFEADTIAHNRVDETVHTIEKMNIQVSVLPYAHKDF